MKKSSLIIAITIFFNCSTQVKVNKSTEVDIIENQPVSKNGKFSIKNNTSDTYIIDPMGFFGIKKYFENDKPALLMRYPEGYFFRFSDNDCENDLIILKPYDKIRANFTLSRDFSGTDLDVTKISPSNKYSYIIKSAHNIYTAKASGCSNYIDNLVKNGYKVLNDSINAKLKLSF